MTLGRIITGISLMAVGVAFGIASCGTARAQTTCMNLGGGQTICTNGSSSQRLGDFDFNSDGSWGMRIGRDMYLANPPANPQPDAPQYPPNAVQPFEQWRAQDPRQPRRW